MIKLVNVSKYYSTNNVIALGLRKVNLELHSNEFVAIVGESGSGKTTLLNVISGIDSYEDGEMYINGKETSYYSVSDMEDYRKSYVAFVFQSYNLIDSYTVLQNVEAPLILSSYPKEKVRQRAQEIIKKVGLEDHMHHKATKLSGGQKQRVVIARALAKDCPIIAADEPTGNLDSKSAKQIIELLHDISKEKLVIIVTHDFSQVKDYATRKIRVFDGEIVEDMEVKKTDKKDLPTIDTSEHKIQFRDYLKIAFRNLMAVPKKSLLMLVIFTFFSFFVALTYGAYQLVSTESSFSLNQVFTNASPNRVVIRKDDNSVFTQDDLDELDEFSIVKEIVTFDYVLDRTIVLVSTSGSHYTYTDGVFLPLAMIEEDDLEYGRLPANDSEIVIALQTSELSDFDEYLDVNYSTIQDYYGSPDLAYKIVGIVNKDNMPNAAYSYFDSYFFGTDENFSALKDSYYLSNVVSATFSGISSYDDDMPLTIDFVNGFFIIDNTIPDNEIRTAAFKYYGQCELDLCYYPGDLTIVDYYKTTELVGINLVMDDTITNYSDYKLNQATYDRIMYNEVYQVSILTESEIGVPQLVKNIQKITVSPLNYKYHVVYPFDNVAAQDFDAIIILIQNIGLIVLNIVVLLGSTLITYVIFRAIINTKLPDYAIFRTIGANKSVIKRFIYFENFYIVLGAYLIFLIVSISVPLDLVQDTFLYAIKVFNFWNYVVYLILLFVMSVIISRRYCNRIFKQTVQSTLKSDLG
ncbi:MAG: ABC transporter ATP-binding protein/permease [Tenericutes bacterium]|nr:ABC transporter ATP-binding protein/permease [Mycoplasmatota bacterium]